MNSKKKGYCKDGQFPHFLPLLEEDDKQREKRRERKELNKSPSSPNKASSSTSTLLSLYLPLFTDCPKVPDNTESTNYICPLYH